MQLPQLQAHPECVACELSSLGQQTPGMASIWLDTSLPPGPTVPALLVVGSYPSFNEDKAGVPMVGPSGKILRSVYLEAPGLTELATIYIGNALRCYPKGLGKNFTATQKILSACKDHLLADMRAIALVHTDAPLYLWLLGGPAVKQTLDSSVEKALKSKQATLLGVSP